jgi:hypothetical protein
MEFGVSMQLKVHKHNIFDDSGSSFWVIPEPLYHYGKRTKA